MNSNRLLEIHPSLLMVTFQLKLGKQTDRYDVTSHANVRFHVQFVKRANG